MNDTVNNRKRFYIKLQEPEIELPVKSAKDATGKVETLFVTFRRYGSEESDKYLRNFREITERQLSDDEIQALSPEELTTAFIKLERKKAEDIKDFIKQQVVAIRDFPLVIEEAGKYKTKIVNSAKAEKDEELWGEAEECLNFLLDILLDSNPWSSALTSVMHEALYNIQLGKDASIKN